MDTEKKLQELGLTLPSLPRPVGAYLLARQSGDLLFLSGTTCYIDGRPMRTGRVGEELSLQEGYEAARQTALNLISVLKATLGELDRVARIVKLNGYVNSAPGFDRQPEVINGASELLEQLFGERGRHARTSIGVSDLPGHIPVEIELIVEIRPPAPEFPSPVVERLGELGLVPVIEIERAEHAVPLGEALLAAGLPCAEITFRTAAAEEAIRQIAAALPEMLTGAGTVLTIDQARRAVDAGARFVVSPGLNPALVDWCLQEGVPVIPGVATPTEVGMALSRGLSIVKFFPAEALGGVKMLKALAAPFKGVRFIPTGGITAANLADYLKL
ncbi:MAG: bifunctional 4-hydroxy-2-oxoglutarate aldolase/2-dehydro-3-deoxy-phosphogluconate aldolase, partial [Chloroflexia bacterium]